MNARRKTEPKLRNVKGSAGRRPHVATRHVAVEPQLSKEEVTKGAAKAKESISKLLEAESMKKDSAEFWRESVKNANFSMNADGTRRGFISADSFVAETAHIASSARVMGGSKILGGARVEDEAVVFGATLEDEAMVGGRAFIGPNTIMKEKSWAYDNASVMNARLLGGAEVSDYAYVDGGEDLVELHGDVVVAGHAKIIGRNVLRGRMNVRGSYEMVDVGEITSDDLFVK